MRKRLSSRLLSIILTIAICATTVLGCLMTVSAAESCYTFGVATFPSEDDLTQATIDVTFTANDKLPNGFAAGQFTLTEVDADKDDYLTVKSVTAVTEGVNIVNEGNFYVFDGAGYQSVTLALTFGFSQGEASKTGKEYKIKLTDVELYDSDDAYFVQDNANGAVGTISAGCKHSVAPVGKPIASNTEDGYSVYAQSVCTLCGEQFGYQLVPTAESLNEEGANLPTEEDTFEGRTELVTKYDKNGDASADASNSANWVLDCEGTPHRTWGYIDADLKLLDDSKENSEENPYIVENAEQLFYLVKIGGSKTAGKYYKVKDGIRAFHLNPNVTDKTSFEDMMANIGSAGANWDSAAPFQGHFDGNGVIITGIKTTTNHAYAGLFPQIKGNVTIKNVTVMNSYLVGKTAVGGFFGTHIYNSSEGVVYDITVENCAIYQCYMQSTHSSTGVGAIGGYVANSCNPGTGWINGDTVVNNCYVNLDEDYFISTTETSGTGSHGGAIGYQGSSVMNVTNSIFIGIRPYTARNLTGDKISGNYGWQGAKASCYNNVYTTHPCNDAYNNASGLQDFTGRVFTLTDAQFKGKDADLNMLTLDFETVWATTNSYPTLYMPYNRPEAPTNIIYWDGTVASGVAEGSGTEEDPYIINTAAELAWLVQQKADVTDGNYYKVADGIDTIVLQSKEKAKSIMALDSAAEVKSYFESGSFTAWKTTGWETACFAGYFDGNGATIYGMYATSANNAALFCTVDGGAALVNIAIKNSYLTSSADNYQVGALIGTSSSNGYGAKRDGIIWVKNITVANNYLYNGCLSTQITRSGVIGGVQEAIQVENALVYGNDATYGRDSAIYDMPVIGNCYNTIQVAASHYDGLEVKTAVDGEKTLYYNQIKNSIILGADAMNVKEGRGYRKNDPDCYTNVYTDGASGTVALSNGNWTYTEDQIKAITAANAQGVAAQTAMPGLGWNIDWYCGAEGELPSQAVFVTLGVAESSNPDFKIAGTNIVYEDDGSFSMNIHYVPAYENFAPTLYVGNKDCTKLYILDTPVASSKRAEIGDDTAMMFTLSGISARNIDASWYPTLVATAGPQINWSQSAEISVADTASAIIAGNYDAADKNVAAAVLNYGSASKVALNTKEDENAAGTIDLLEFGDYLTEAGSTSKYWDTNVADNGETGDSWENAIIIDSAEELVYLCKASGNETSGKYYKVADGIAGFDLSKGDLNLNGTLAQNINKIKAGGKNHAGNTPGFQGHFDGNGATVYGAWTNHESVSLYVGLFSCTYGEVTIKNIHVNKAHFTGKNATGGIIGYHKADDMCTVTIENCSVTDSYLEVQGTGYGCGVGAIIGYGASAPSWKEADKGVDGNGDGDMVDTIYVNVAYNIKNCYVNLDEQYFVSKAEDGVEESGERVCHGGVAGVLGSNALAVSNCVVIGITPYATNESTAQNDVQHSGMENHFANVYTTAATGKINIAGTAAMQNRDFTGKVFQLTKEQMTGAAAKENMPALNWDTVWTVTDGYPTFISTNYKAPASGITVTWDGTVASGFASGTGTKEDPYIISTASEFAYMVKDKMVSQAATISPNKYFKVADGISAFVMQKPEYASDIITLGSAADTKAYFEANKDNMLTWPIYGWEGSSFCGYFDGNGATVYGLYQKSGSNAGLFSSVDAGAVISNIALKNSYLTSTATNYQVAGIAAVGNSTGYGVMQEGVTWINGCTVANNYMYNACTSYARSGVIAGSFQNDIVVIDNCLTYGNDATYGDGVKMAVIGQGNNDVEVTKLKPAELPSYIENGGFFCNSVRNSIILDCDVINEKEGASWRRNAYNCYSNVYTNGTLGETFYNGAWATGYANVLFPITAADVQGDAAETIVSVLNTAAIGDTTWYKGAAGDMPGFKEAGALNSSLQAIYDGITLKADDYADSIPSLFGVYSTSVNLNANPYMTFVFEFGQEYKTNRDKITVKFTYTVDGEEVTTEVAVPAFEGDGTIDNVNGWYNKPSAGRFHTYRFRDIPVEALASDIKVSASYNGGADVNFGTFSVAGLAYEFDKQNKITPSDYYATRIEAAKALLFYTQMIQARYGA